MIRSCTELLDELNDLDEHPRIEGKSAREIGKSVLETVCAFANEPGLGGGYLLLGVCRDEAVPGAPYIPIGVPDPGCVQNDLVEELALPPSFGPATMGANRNYLDEGVRLLELAKCAAELFRKQAPSEKRRLLNFVLSNSLWKDGRLTQTFRQPFDMLAETVKAAGAAGGGTESLTPSVDTWRPQRVLDILTGRDTGVIPFDIVAGERRAA